MSWVIGVVMNICGSVGASSGLLVQKKAAQIQDERIKQGLKPYNRIGGILLSPMWLLGFCLLIFIPVPLDFFAYQFVAQSLVAPLGAMSVVFTMVLAPCITKEKVTKIDYLGAFIILGGCAITTITGSKDDALLTLADLASFIGNTDFLFMEGALLIFAVTSYFSSRIKWIETHPIMSKVRPVFFAFVSGFFGATNNVALKCTSNLIDVPGIFTTWPIYVSICCVICCSAMQISWLNLGLKYYDGILFLPIYNTCLIILTAATGSVFYQEYKSQSYLDLGIFVVGCLVACFGVMVIAFKPKEKEGEKESPSPNKTVSRPRSVKNSNKKKDEDIVEIQLDESSPSAPSPPQVETQNGIQVVVTSVESPLRGRQLLIHSPKTPLRPLSMITRSGASSPNLTPSTRRRRVESDGKRSEII